MSDSISRQAAIDSIEFECGEWIGLARTIVKAIEQLPSAPERKTGEWIPVAERLPEEDHWLGGSGRQFSDEVLVSVVNYDDEDIWTYISQTIDGEWALELPSHCKIIAWMPLPEPYGEDGEAT